MLIVARRLYSMRRCWMSATLCFKGPWASVPGVCTGLGRNHAPVNCQSTSLQVANLHLENHFTQRKKRRRIGEKETREKKDGEEKRKHSRLPWRGSRGIKHKQRWVAHGVVSSERSDSFLGLTGTLGCRSLLDFTSLFPSPLLLLYNAQYSPTTFLSLVFISNINCVLW